MGGATAHRPLALFALEQKKVFFINIRPLLAMRFAPSPRIYLYALVGTCWIHTIFRCGSSIAEADIFPQSNTHILWPSVTPAAWYRIIERSLEISVWRSRIFFQKAWRQWFRYNRHRKDVSEGRGRKKNAPVNRFNICKAIYTSMSLTAFSTFLHHSRLLQTTISDSDFFLI